MKFLAKTSKGKRINAMKGQYSFELFFFFLFRMIVKSMRWYRLRYINLVLNVDSMVLHFTEYIYLHWLTSLEEIGHYE